MKQDLRNKHNGAKRPKYNSDFLNRIEVWSNIVPLASLMFFKIIIMIFLCFRELCLEARLKSVLAFHIYLTIEKLMFKGIFLVSIFMTTIFPTFIKN